MAKEITIDYDRETDTLYVRIKGVESGLATWDPEELDDLLVGRDAVDDALVGFEVPAYRVVGARLLRHLEHALHADYLRMRFSLSEAGLREASLKDALDWAYKRYVVGQQK